MILKKQQNVKTLGMYVCMYARMYACMYEKLLLKGEGKGKQGKVKGEVRDKTALQVTQQDEGVIQTFLH